MGKSILVATPHIDPNSQVHTFRVGSGVPFRYCQAFGTHTTITTWTTDETDIYNRIGESGSWSKFRIFIYSNNSNGSSIFKTRIDQVDGNQSITVPSSITGWFTDQENTDNITYSNLISIMAVTASGVSSGECNCSTVVGNFHPIDANKTISVFGSTIGFIAETDIYTIGYDRSLSELVSQIQTGTSGKFKKLWADITSFTSDDPLLISFRNSGSVGNQQISFNGTGQFFDDSEDDVEVGDFITLGVTGFEEGKSCNIKTFSITFETNNNKFLLGGSKYGSFGEAPPIHYGSCAIGTNVQSSGEMREVLFDTGATASFVSFRSAVSSGQNFILRGYVNGSSQNIISILGTTSGGRVSSSFTHYIPGESLYVYGKSDGLGQWNHHTQLTMFEFNEEFTPPLPYDGPLTITINPFGNYPVRIKHLPQGTPVRIIPPV
jgi:hypothetical protein